MQTLANTDYPFFHGEIYRKIFWQETTIILMFKSLQQFPEKDGAFCQGQSVY